MSALLFSATLFEQHQIRRLYDDATCMKLTVAPFNEMRHRKQKYGMVTIPLRRNRSCVGTGPCAASVFELLN